ncbi:MAG TPA: type II toxin-antitoxin system RelE/ParE family toxin [Candidatus Rhabdochlamydia sp.]|nr:type II toxin-antitoxin system RelE/ParE family toxin [Candidatus Rhabdochlamydia sp.]
MDGLVENSIPLGSIKLHGYTTLYRIRSGDYRVIYSIKKDLLIILVVEIGHRKEIYR